MINILHSNPGYLEVVNFLNLQSTNPTPGNHQVIVQEIFDAIHTNNYWGYIQEFYANADPLEYHSVILVTNTGKAILLREGNIMGVSLDATEVRSVAVVEQGRGLTMLYSDVCELFDDATLTVPTAEFQIYIANELGGDIYNAYYRINNDIVGRGEVKALLVENQDLGAYNVMIEKDATPVISFLSARNFYTKFYVRVSESEKRYYSYYTVGQVMYIEDNSFVRAELTKLAKQGVIFYS